MNTITPMDSANQEVWIGVDVGTTGVRAIAYTEDGTNVCSSEAFYPLLTPHPDWPKKARSRSWKRPGSHQQDGRSASI
mgnify:CR=1 FL=1